MQDTVIKGNGRSRIIKGPADMPATYNEWRAQVMAGTAQLDVSVNPDITESGGISQLGTPLNKANLLTDEAAALFGLMDDATIDAMFKALWSLRAQKNGFATLDSSGKVPSTQLPSMDYIPTAQKGVANGVATLNSNSKLRDSQMPSLIEYPTYSLDMTICEYSSGETNCIIIQRKVCVVNGYAIFKGHEGTTVDLNFDKLKIGEKYYKPKLSNSSASVNGKSNYNSPLGALDPLDGRISDYLGRGFQITSVLENLSLEANNIITFSATFEVEEGR